MKTLTKDMQAPTPTTEVPELLKTRGQRIIDNPLINRHWQQSNETRDSQHSFTAIRSRIQACTTVASIVDESQTSPIVKRPIDSGAHSIRGSAVIFPQDAFPANPS